jgi:hypothetical protein
MMYPERFAKAFSKLNSGDIMAFFTVPGVFARNNFRSIGVEGT